MGLMKSLVSLLAFICFLNTVESEPTCSRIQMQNTTLAQDADVITQTYADDVTSCVDACCDLAESDQCTVALFETWSSQCYLIRCQPVEECQTGEEEGLVLTFVQLAEESVDPEDASLSTTLVPTTDADQSSSSVKSSTSSLENASNASTDSPDNSSVAATELHKNSSDASTELPHYAGANSTTQNEFSVSESNTIPVASSDSISNNKTTLKSTKGITGTTPSYETPSSSSSKTTVTSNTATEPTSSSKRKPTTSIILSAIANQSTLFISNVTGSLNVSTKTETPAPVLDKNGTSSPEFATTNLPGSPRATTKSSKSEPTQTSSISESSSTKTSPSTTFRSPLTSEKSSSFTKTEPVTYTFYTDQEFDTSFTEEDTSSTKKSPTTSGFRLTSSSFMFPITTSSSYKTTSSSSSFNGRTSTSTTKQTKQFLTNSPSSSSSSSSSYPLITTSSKMSSSSSSSSINGEQFSTYLTESFPSSVSTTESSSSVSSGNNKGNQARQQEVEVLSAGLISALCVGIVCFFCIMVLVGKRFFDSWQRRHYSRMDYLINGMYN